jgi:VIT1/CCC1 family predicted Fe2+/Mn2+ transporter
MDTAPDPKAAAQRRLDIHVQERHGITGVRSELREAVFGVQDGLISTMGALTGIAAGTQNREAVVIAGFVIMAVESLSMSAGSYLSSKSQRQYLERLLKEEEEEIARNPEGERAELRDMYRIRGFTESEIDIIVNRIMSNPKLALEDMAHKELGIAPGEMEEPLGNAVVMGIAYAVGGAIPVLFYLLLPLQTAMPASVAGTLLALFLFGGLKGRLVNQSWWRSGLEMLAVAGAAALAGYLIGRAADAWVLRS